MLYHKKYFPAYTAPAFTLLVQHAAALRNNYAAYKKICYITASWLLVCCVSLLAATFISTAQAVANQPAPSWQAILAKHPATPPRLIAVDKDKQELYVYNIDAKLKLQKSYVCTTGQSVGDKQVQGDLKTPEGIYFVVQHLDSGLDFSMYGHEAYTLNYPNPVDRLRKKTGYGIWIHGKGESIRPLITQGCVALNNEDLEVLGTLLEPGVPVALTSSLAPIEQTPAEQLSTVTELKQKVEGWAKAWGSRSAEMFEYYDAKAYSLAQGEDFSKFKGQKERLFKHLPWIKTSVSDIQVLQGPGYWVTWFYQDYEAPNLSTQGIRRLYWQKDEQGKFVIVGMEWVPGLSSGSMLASAEPASPPIEVAPKSEEQATPLPNAVLAVETPAVTAMPPAEPQFGHSEDVSSPNAPRPQLALALYQQGKLADIIDAPSQEKGTAAPVVAIANTSGQATTASDVSAHVAHLNLPPPIPAQGLAESSLLPTATDVTTVSAQANAPVVQTVAQATSGTPVTSPPQEEALSQAIPPVQTVAEAAPATQAPDATSPSSTPAVSAVAPKAADEPLVAMPEIAPEATGQVPEGVATKAASVADASLITPATQRLVLDTIEEWRQVWEKGDIESYAEFYLKNSVQGNRKGSDAIVQHKKKLWVKAAPQSVTLSDIRLVQQDADIVVEMTQAYTDVRNQGDVGRKVLYLTFIDGMWFITNETWSPLAP